jgi:AmiR/NasT family two-component response regulator
MRPRIRSAAIAAVTEPGPPPDERADDELSRARERIANLEIALQSNRRIGIAIGILMATYKITEDAGFDRLRVVSQDRHRKVADVADDVIQTGDLPAS